MVGGALYPGGRAVPKGFFRLKSQMLQNSELDLAFIKVLHLLQRTRSPSKSEMGLVLLKMVSKEGLELNVTASSVHK